MKQRVYLLDVLFISIISISNFAYPTVKTIGSKQQKVSLVIAYLIKNHKLSTFQKQEASSEARFNFQLSLVSDKNSDYLLKDQFKQAQEKLNLLLQQKNTTKDII